MNKVVINNCYGGFGLSEKAVQRYQELSGVVLKSWETPCGIAWATKDIPRHDPALVQVVEELGKCANGKFACLGTVEIPGNRYYITEYDGVEEVHYPEAEGSWIVIED